MSIINNNHSGYNSLPKDMFNNVASYLSSIRELGTLLTVCKGWKSMGQADKIWHTAYQRYFTMSSLKMPHLARVNNHQNFWLSAYVRAERDLYGPSHLNWQAAHGVEGRIGFMRARVDLDRVIPHMLNQYEMLDSDIPIPAAFVPDRSVSLRQFPDRLLSAERQVVDRMRQYVHLRCPTPKPAKHSWYDHCASRHPNTIIRARRIGETASMVACVAVAELALYALFKKIYDAGYLTDVLGNVQNDLLSLLGVQIGFIANAIFHLNEEQTRQLKVRLKYGAISALPHLLYGSSKIPIVANAVFGSLALSSYCKLNVLGVKDIFLNSFTAMLLSSAFQSTFPKSLILNLLKCMIYQSGAIIAGVISHASFKAIGLKGDCETHLNKVIEFGGQVAEKPIVHRCAWKAYCIGKKVLNVSIKFSGSLINSYLNWRENSNG